LKGGNERKKRIDQEGPEKRREPRRLPVFYKKDNPADEGQKKNGVNECYGDHGEKEIEEKRQPEKKGDVLGKIQPFWMLH